MALLLVDTPGRGSSLRLKRLPAQADYEKPVAHVLDYLGARPEVDSGRLALVGSSMGGYYAPRAACFDDRVKALVLNSACFDLIEDVYDFYPPIQRQLRWVVGASSDAEAREAYRAFSLREIAGRITCPVFVSHGADDFIMRPAGAERLFEALAGKEKHLRIWQRDDGGAMHCSYDGWAMLFPLLFDWLADRLS
jgi:dipeptidyl aminopeptidase/acylaminoacyl peptidase